MAHLYPSRALEVVWDEGTGRIDRVVLGRVATEPRHGAATLLGELVVRWRAFEAVGFREPRAGSLRVRHQRLAAIARALDLGTVEDVAHGRAMARRADEHAALLRVIARCGPGADLRCFAPPERVYVHLLQYRVDAEVLLGATRGWLECGDCALLSAIAAQDAIAATLRRELAPIEEWLCRFLDPSGRTFSERELGSFGWPDVDPVALEFEEELG